MNTVNPLPSADGKWQWNQLLDYVEAGLVVPMVGRELRTEIDGTPQYVPIYLARQFCARARLPWSDDLATEPDPVGVVVQRFLSTTPKGVEERSAWMVTESAESTFESNDEHRKADEACSLEVAADVSLLSPRSVLLLDRYRYWRLSRLSPFSRSSRKAPSCASFHSLA